MTWLESQELLTIQSSGISALPTLCLEVSFLNRSLRLKVIEFYVWDFSVFELNMFWFDNWQWYYRLLTAHSVLLKAFVQLFDNTASSSSWTVKHPANLLLAMNTHECLTRFCVQRRLNNEPWHMKKVKDSWAKLHVTCTLLILLILIAQQKCTA